MPYTRPILLSFIALFAVVGCQDVPDEPEHEPPPSSDIWLYRISDTGVDSVARITDRDGYDNQPSFTPDGAWLLFSSDRPGRTATFAYDLTTGEISRITHSEADVYSPTPIPGTGGAETSVVHVDPVVRQGLWRYSLDGSTDPSPIVDVDDVAYFTWVGEGSILFWRLGEPNTLQLIDVATSDTTVLDEGTVVSLQPMPSDSASSYIIQKGEEQAVIKRFDWISGQSTPIVPAVEGGQYFCWTPGGELLMPSGGSLYSYSGEDGSEWELKVELGITGATRCAVSPDGELLAVVGLRE